ncbi:MBL fold metallo-hydrolase [Aeropyrum camini]|uniref:MBL fold metallo-hydrolase n=1 Tax=Aeropyrum camini TaxID=229980 RepID=UPI001E2BB681|nr:MBL fold metallo-hydrolase [Aeropyrum camini]
MKKPFSMVNVWIPIQSLGSVNVAVFRKDSGEVDIVDAGMYSARSIHDLIAKVKNKIRGRIEGVGKIVITHFHVDHMSGAAILKEVFEPTVFIGVGELDTPLRSGSPDMFVENILSLYREHGVPEAVIESIRRTHPVFRTILAYRAFSSLDLRPIYPGDILKLGEAEYRALPAPGHTPGHIVLESLDGTHAIVGDTLLERITPSVILYDESHDPLGHYLKTLEMLAQKNYLVAYPGHGNPIISPAERARELVEHHRKRLEEVLSLLRRKGSMTGYEVASSMKWRTSYSNWAEYPPVEKFFAIGEALAHLKRLQVEMKVEVIERDGVKKFRIL